MSDPQIIVALDYDDRLEALALVDKVNPALCRLKVGKEMFTRFGPGWVETLQHRGFDVFLDLKFHDIPHTVARSVAAAADLGVWMVNVHASGGRRMLETCVETLDARTGHRPQLIAVTVLTSMQSGDLSEVGIDVDPAAHVDRLAALTKNAGLDGVVCSAQEAARLRDSCGPDFCLVTPGIRPENSALGDQRRTTTPAEAVTKGSTYLVVGRPVTQASDPLAVLQNIKTEIDDLN